MMKTLLSTIQAFCYKSNIPAPTTLYGSTDPGTLQLLHCAYAAAEELRAAKCWPQMKRVHTFETVDEQSAYQLPADFYAVLPFTETDEENSVGILPTSDEEAAYNLYRIALASGNYSYRLFGFDENTASTTGQFNLIPEPTAVGTITFEYLSRNLFIPKNWAASTSFGAGSYCNASGNIYYSSAGGTTGTTVPSHTTGSASDGVVTWTYYSTPYETIKADTDLCIFDSDLMQLGLRAHWLDENEKDNSKAIAAFQNRITSAAGRMEPPKVGSFSRRVIQKRYQTPYKSWSL